ncbi:MAG: hypothetical protein QOE68_3374, partial [Thermoanaerobaculia bacterium]|nr:hypothetical protein [Thermoanaerobaculia bacterium]
MKKVLVVLASLTLVAASALAQNASDLNPKAGHHGTNDANGNNGNGNGNDDNNGNGNGVSNKATPGGSGNLVNHGGGVMNGGKVVCIFWGSIPSSYSSNMQSFRTSSSGIVAHTGMLTQYGVSATNLVGTHADVFDPNPPSSTRVTDAMVQAEVARTVGFNPASTNTIYEVFIP